MTLMLVSLRADQEIALVVWHPVFHYRVPIILSSLKSYVIFCNMLLLLRPPLLLFLSSSFSFSPLRVSCSPIPITAEPLVVIRLPVFIRTSHPEAVYTGTH